MNKKKTIKNSILEPFKNLRNRITKKHENRQKTKDNNELATAQVEKIIANKSNIGINGSNIIKYLYSLEIISTLDMSADKKDELRKKVVEYIKEMKKIVLQQKVPNSIIMKFLKDTYVAWQIGNYRFYQRTTKKKNKETARKLFNSLNNSL